MFIRPLLRVLACLSSLSLLTLGAQAQEWRRSEAGVTLNDVFMTSATSGWVVGEGGVIRRTTNGGATWQFQPSGTSEPLYEVFFLNSTTGWVAGGNSAGQILRTTDAGATWQVATIASGPVVMYGLHFIDASTGWAVGGYPTGIYKTTNGGVTWTAQTAGTSQALNDVHFTDASTGWAVGDVGTLLKTVDGGTTWTEQTSGTSSALYKIQFLDANTGWAVGGGGGVVLRTTNGGTSWTASNAGSSNLKDVHFISATTGRVVDQEGRYYTSADGGATWAGGSVIAEHNNLAGVHFVTSQIGWATGQAALLKTFDGGANWQPQIPGVFHGYSSVDFVNASTGWAVGAADGQGASTLVKTTNGGQSWTRQITGATHDLTNVQFLDASTGMAVGWNGTFIKTTDGGDSWTTIPTGTTSNLYALAFTDANTGWIGGDSGLVRKTINGGTNWTTQTLSGAGEIKVLQFMDANTGWALAENGKAYKTTNGGTDWTSTTVSPAMTFSLFMQDANTGWVGGGGNIYVTTNAGALWTEVTLPTAGEVRSIHFTDTSTGWAVDEVGTVLRTTNGGTSWVTDSTVSLYALSDITNAGSDRLFATGTNGEIWSWYSGFNGGVLEASFSSASTLPLSLSSVNLSGKTVNLSLNFAPPVGTQLTVVENTGLPFISGEFSNLAHGQAVTLTHNSRNYDFVANYYGGSGNDLVLVWKKTRLVVAGRGGPQAGVSPATSGNITIMRDVGAAGGLLEGKTIFQVAGSFDHTVVLCSDGTLLSWGEGFYGALGYGSLTTRNQPGLVDQTGVLAGKRVVSIAASGRHTLVLCSDGTLASWGENGQGQIGDGTTTKRSSPVLVSTSGALAGKTPVAISVGNNGTNIVLCSDGTLVGWGPSNSYELLQGNRTTQPTPVTLNIASSPLVGRTVASFGIGIASVTVLCTDGTLVSWGAGLYGALGTGSENESQTPTLVNVGAGSALQGKTAKSLSVGDAEVLVLCTDNTLVSWGLFSGDGVDTARRLLPTLVSTSTALAGKTVVKIGCHANDKNVICSDGTLAVWGGNYNGELSVGTTANVVAPAAAITNIASDEAFTATTADSASSNIFYIVSTDGVPDISVEPVVGSPFVDGVSSVALGNSEPGVPTTQSFTLANNGSEPLTITGITKTGTHAAQFTVSSASFPIVLPKLSSIGINITFTPVGTGARTAALQITCNDPDEATFDLGLSGTGVALSTAPVVANFVTGNEVPVSAPSFTAAGRTLNLTLGHTPVTGRNFTVVENTGLAPIFGTFTGLAQGQSVPLTFGGQTYYYVADYFGGVGNNDLVLVWAANRIFTWGPTSSNLGRPTADNSTPRFASNVTSLSGRTVIKLASGRDHALALCSDGSLACWGDNSFGQRGIQGSPNSFLVNQTGVLAGKRIIDIAAGQYHSLALCSDGTLAAWGAGFDGALGNGGTDGAYAPILVNRSGALAGKQVVAISSGLRTSYALCSDGTAYAWGDNASGQIGDGTATRRLIPVAVKRTATALAGKLIKQLKAGNVYAVALCTDGSLVSWGATHLGRGIGSDSSPTAVAINTGAGSVFAGKTIASFSVGDAGPIVRCTDGTLAAWGFAAGDDTGTGNDNSPVLVDVATSALVGKTVTHILGCADTRFAIAADGSMAGWGNNDEFRVGDGTNTTRYLPVSVVSSGLGPDERFAWFGNGSSSQAIMAVVAGPAVGEIDVQEFANNSLTDGSGQLNFGYVILNTPRTKTVTIKNVGVGLLTGLTISIDGEGADAYDVTVPPVTPVLPGESTSFTLEFKPTANTSFDAAIHISSNDSDENPFDLNLYGYGYGAPYLYLYDADENDIETGDTFAFGDAATNTPRLRTFIVENDGELLLTNIAVSFPTNPSGHYSLVTAPPTSLAPGERDTFVVSFAPNALGASNAIMHLTSNDEESPYIVPLTGNGITPTAPEIDVIHETGGSVALTDNTGTIALGDAVLGIGRTHTFSIRNTGTAPLTGLALSKTGTNAGDIIFSTLEKTTLAFQESLEFTVTFLPGAVGARAATIRVASNDANENPFDIALTANGTTPELDVTLPGPVAVADGSSVNLGTNLPVGVDVLRSFTLKNNGTATLQINDIVIDGLNAADFEAELGSSNVAPGASTTLDLTFTPYSFGARVAALHIVCNDTNESPYDIKLTGTAVGPEISVEQPAATVLADGAGTINFGPAVQPAFAARTFTIKNPGTASLTGISTSIVGSDAANFTVTTAPPATLASKGTTTFVVRFTPDALRVFNASLRIASNDYDENPFDIALTGEGVETLTPVFDVHPQSQIVALGAPVTFTTTVDSPTAFTSLWRKGTTTFASISGATAVNYTLPAVKLTDAAVLYRNRATNAAGFTDSNPAALTVVDRTSKTQNLASGAPKATFTVSAATTPGSTLTYLWLKDGEALPADPDYVATGNTLVINTLVPDDAGTYTCEVTGPGGTLAGGDNILTIFDSAPVISPNPVVMDEGIVSGDYSFFIPLDENEGTPTSYTATPLPAGLKFNTATGEFTGKPTTAKSYTLTLTAKNTLGTSTATATLLVKPLTPGADGDYLGIIARGPVNDDLGGRFELKVTPTGSYTGKVFLGAKSYSFPAGSITATSGSPLVTGSLSILRAPLPALAVTFTINTTTKRVTTGAVSSSGLGSSSFTGWKNTWNATTQATDYDGYYTFSLDVPNNLSGDEDIPQGLGFGSFKVPLKGESFAIVGQTADGDKFTSSTFLGPDGDLALFDDLPSKGSLVGILDIVPGAADTNTLAGAPTWSRPASTAATATTYKAGFAPYALVIMGGHYAAPAATAIILGKPTPARANNAGLAFFDAGLDDEPSLADRRVSLIPGKSLTIAASGPTLTTLKIATDTGLISGGFTLTDAHPVTPGAKPIVRKTTFQGIIVRTPGGGQEGHGYFLLQQLPAPVFPLPTVLPVLSGGVILE